MTVMDRWEIRPSPTSEDPDRHLLLINGGPTDVTALLKRFGALFGRPSPYYEEGFNLSLVLHRLTPETRGRLDAWLGQAVPPSSASTAAPAPPPPGSPPLVSPETAALEQILPPAAPEPPALISLSDESAPPAPPPSLDVPPALPAAVPAPLVSGGAPAAPAPPAEASFLLPLQQSWTMETLLVGAYNRFAHAAATSVVTSPGTMYNPLFLYGVPGTGKSHMLHAIASALAKTTGPRDLFLTSGFRLSRAVDAGLAGGGLDEIDKLAVDAKALLIDDIHLMSVSDHNKGALASIFKNFFGRQQQVVITSLYPPRALGSLEEALGFSFSKGWSVDLKLPSPGAQKDLITVAADRAGGRFSSDEITLMHEKFSQWGYQELSLWLRRLTLLKKLREAAGAPAAAAELLSMIYDPILAGAAPLGGPQSPLQPPPASPEDAALAVVVPKDQQAVSAAVAALFYEVGAKNGFPQSYRQASWDVYDAQQPFGVPFLIGEICCRAGAARALIVGPAPDSPLGPRSVELAHAVRRILESLGVGTGWIPFTGSTVAAHYLNAHLDLLSMTASI